MCTWNVWRNVCSRFCWCFVHHFKGSVNTFQADQCHLLAAQLLEQNPDSETPVLINAAQYVREKNIPKAIQILTVCWCFFSISIIKPFTTSIVQYNYIYMLCLRAWKRWRIECVGMKVTSNFLTSRWCYIPNMKVLSFVVSDKKIFKNLFIDPVTYLCNQSEPFTQFLVDIYIYSTVQGYYNAIPSSLHRHLRVLAVKSVL